MFYPPLRDKQEAHDIVEEGIGEHHRVEELLRRMESIPADSDDWIDELQSVRDCVRHHVREDPRPCASRWFAGAARRAA